MATWSTSGVDFVLTKPKLSLVNLHLLQRHFTLLYKMDASRAVYFTQEEQIVMMNSFEEFKNEITVRGNTVAHNREVQLCFP